MNEENEFLKILQDPLLTLLGLILFGMLWIIVPGNYALKDSISFVELRKQTTMIERAIKDYEDKFHQEKIKLVEKQNAVKYQNSELATKALLSEVQDLEERAKNLKLQIRSQTGFIYTLRNLLQESDENIENFVKWLERDRNQLQDQISTVRQQVKFLRDSKNKLENQAKNMTRASRAEILPEEGQSVIFLEADGREIFWILKPNYEFVELDQDAFLNVAVRSTSANGERDWEIERGFSVFQQVLQDVEPSRAVLYFYVRQDSFDVFLKARLIAERYGFSVGWDPKPEGPILFSTRSLEGRKPKVRPPGG